MDIQTMYKKLKGNVVHASSQGRLKNITGFFKQNEVILLLIVIILITIAGFINPRFIGISLSWRSVLQALVLLFLPVVLTYP